MTIAIIGGTGLYSLEDLKNLKEQTIETPFGKPSAPLIHGKYGDQNIIFLARHGRNHELLPHEINYRANIFALKSANVDQIISISAIGSLQEALKPGHFVISSQYIDWIQGAREKTFFGDGLVAHVSTAEPTCRSLTTTLANTARKIGITLHTDKTYICVNGPRFGTKAESFLLKNTLKGDVVGMTNMPEVFLAREAQICYCPIGIVTDYDCWYDEPSQQVDAASAIEQYKKSLEQTKTLLRELFTHPLPSPDAYCRRSLKNALLTKRETLNQKQQQLLEILEK
jgi:5'-methylthioadenosine phosphorylase